MKIWKTSLLIIGITLFLILSAMAANAETETDAQGDVWHYVYPYYQSQTVLDQPNCDIKEIKAEISGDQITLSMTLWPGGTFSRSQYEYATYIMYYNTSDAWYMLTYSDLAGEESGGVAMGYSLGTYDPPFATAEVTVNSETISATMDKVGDDTTTTELYGLSWIWEGYGAEQYDYDHWHDWVGDYTWIPDLNPDEVEPEPDDGDENITCWQCNENNESVSQTFPAGTVCGEGDAEEYPYNTKPNCGNGNGGDGGTTGSPGFEIFALIIGITILIFMYKRKK